LNSASRFRQIEAMNTSRRSAAGSPALLLLLAFFITARCPGADPQPGVAKVQAILGQAQFSKAGGPFTPLGPGMVLRAGDLVQTATGSAVDLYLGEIAGTIRLTESATLVLDKLTMGDSSGSGLDVQLNLRGGELLGLVKPVPQDSRFEIKVSNGIAHIIQGRFRMDANGRVVVLEGKAIFAHVPPSGEASAHTLTAPPGVYFAPLEGIQPATKNLTREIMKQMRSKLPRR
jgi:hypothetical protein